MARSTSGWTGHGGSHWEEYEPVGSPFLGVGRGGGREGRPGSFPLPQGPILVLCVPFTKLYS